MRTRVLLAALIALVVAGSAGATPGPAVKHVRLVRHVGVFTATLTYTDHPKRLMQPVGGVRIRIERGARVLSQRTLCQPHMLRRYRCDSWGSDPSLSVIRVGPADTPAFAVNIWTGGNTCCQATFIAIPRSKVSWIDHTFSFLGAGIMRRHRRSFYTGTDGRFYCAFSVCAGASTPIQIWTIDAANRFVDVTRHFPALVRQQAHRLATGGGRPGTTIRDQGSGILAPWCADEYLLGHPERCARALREAMKRHWPKKMQGAIPGHGFARALKRDLRRWGYARSARR